MMLRKQTVWLLTMLAVMVVLSGYYLAKGPQQQMPAAGQQFASEKQQPIAGVVVETKQVDQPPQAATVNSDKQANAEAKGDNATNDGVPVAETVSEIFQGYKMKREAEIQQQKDEQLAIMSSPDSSPQAVAEAKAKYEELSTLDSALLNVEEMLKASGYQDAVVFMNDDRVTVIVQKEQLSASEAVEIIAHVKKQLNVPATNVSVKFQSS